MRTTWTGLAGSALVALAVEAGCGDGRPAVTSATTEARATGVVRINGKPASAGTITFDPANIRRDAMPRSSAIGKDGTYDVTTLVGENKVSVTGPEVANDPRLSVNQKLVDLRDGSNALDINLP